MRMEHSWILIVAMLGHLLCVYAGRTIQLLLKEGQCRDVPWPVHTLFDLRLL